MEKIINIEEIKNYLKDDMTIMVGGFMTCGTPELIVDEILKSNIKNLTIISNDAGFENKGVGKLIKAKQVKKLIASHIGLNPLAGEKMSKEEMEVELIPQGTLAEKIRCGGVGLGGFLTPTGIGTIIENNKEIIEKNGKKYILEEPLKADLSIIYGNEVDNKGNIIYSKTAQNFNPLMAMAGEKVICQARKVINSKDMNSSNIHTPHIFVDHIVKED